MTPAGTTVPNDGLAPIRKCFQQIIRNGRHHNGARQWKSWDTGNYLLERNGWEQEGIVGNNKMGRK